MAERLTEIEGTFAQYALRDEDLVTVRHYLLAKTMIDRILGAVLLVLCLPAIGLLALAVRIDSEGPAIFRQQRVGRGGELFTIFKLRSMAADAPAYSYKVGLGDQRITRVGRWLRRSGLDELPQLWNVVKGDMSLIGPRPELPFIVEGYQNGEQRRHSIRPGITGWWQIHHRNEVPMHLNLDYDFYYINNLSFQLDLRIAKRTFTIMLEGLRNKHLRARDLGEEKIQTFS